MLSYRPSLSKRGRSSTGVCRTSTVPRPRSVNFIYLFIYLIYCLVKYIQCDDTVILSAAARVCRVIAGKICKVMELGVTCIAGKIYKILELFENNCLLVVICKYQLPLNVVKQY